MQKLCTQSHSFLILLSTVQFLNPIVHFFSGFFRLFAYLRKQAEKEIEKMNIRIEKVNCRMKKGERKVTENTSFARKDPSLCFFLFFPLQLPICDDFETFTNSMFFFPQSMQVPCVSG